MKLPLSWLSEFIDLPTTDPRELADTLAMVGHEVEGIEELPVGWSDVVIARVVSVEPHPDADKVRLCQVTTGGDPIDVVCGAWNFDEGAVVAFALPGAVLGDDFEIGVRDIRGVESHGMICSERELGIGDDQEGILVLADDAPVGKPLEEVVELPEVVFDLDITPNRPDAMSLLGIARDLAAWYDIDYRIPEMKLSTIDKPASISVVVEAGSPRFAARHIDDVTVGPSPLMVRHRLRKAGVRPISNLVDVTNYVMLELGQPLHVFDADKIEGGRLVVRHATQGETLVTLDGVERDLRTDDVVICDDTGPVSLAGTMGGEGTEVSTETTNTILEAAAWDPPSIMYTSRFHGLRSEASARFERGVDPNLPPLASERAAAMIASLSGGTVRSGWVDEVVTETRPAEVNLDLSYVSRVLGEDFDVSVSAGLLKRLGMKVGGEDPLVVTVPTNRPDVTRPADLIEEIARIHGYEKFPSRLRPGIGGRPTEPQRRRGELQRLLADLGIDHAITLSLIHAQDVTALDPPEDHEWSHPVIVKNPLREEEALLRPSLLPGLLRSVAYNRGRGVADVALFEMGRVFHATPWNEDPRVPSQPEHLGLVIAGDFGDRLLDGSGREADVSTLLAVVRGIGHRLGLDLRLEAATAPGFHPTRTAQVTVGSEAVGHVGELHPHTTDAFELEGRVAAGELALDALLAAPGTTVYEAVSGYPHVDFDLSFDVPSDLATATLVDITTSAAGDLLEWARPFDHYSGGNLDEGRKAVAIRYRLRASDRTLTADDVAPVRQVMITAATVLDARLRGGS